MNRDKAIEVLKAYGSVIIETKSGDKISFARQTLQNIEEIEKIPTEELVQHWKSLVWMNYIYSQVSLNEMQRIDLIELEFEEREITEDLKEWYKNAQETFDNSQEQL